MAFEYGVNVTNKYGNISDDEEFDDPRELLQKVTALAAQKKEDKPAAKPAPPTKEAPKPFSSGKENRPASGGERGRGSRGRGRGGAGRPREGFEHGGERTGETRGRGGPRRGGERGERGGRPFRGRGGAVTSPSSEESPNKEHSSYDENFDGNTEGRPRGRGRGGFTLGGRGGGGRGGRGRQFDRQSGSDRTGVRSFEKKDGHGKGNWGDQKDELAAETENLASVEENQEPEAPREKTAEEIRFEQEKEEFAKMKTLKEFRAQSQADAHKFNTRKAGEGDNENFGKLVPIKKDLIPDKEEDEIVVVKKEPKKQLLDINITFAENNRGGRDNRDFRSERGNDRPARGRGSGRGRGGAGNSSRAYGTTFDSSLEAFPALGAK
ncbi:unnamed protein product [Caenorhabditis auriculariae]|uniref:Hyaluronan/mRNA-binding protein domain-containing protein n=1 Tax=Caenorhabditis auriculariae TaxID=2777116 RepID=A0A8S1HDQ7_9PELO|nr:unnamed protein product [Caenorhabditis auriculariae]